MKRILPLFLSLILVFTCFIVPASASENDSLVNLLDFGTITNSDTGNYIVSSSNNVNVKYDLPGWSYLSYCDILFNCTEQPAVVLVSGTNLTIKKVSGNLYRAFGHIASPPRRDHVSSYFKFHTTVERTIEIYSFNVALTQTAFVSECLRAHMDVYVDNSRGSYTMASPSDSHTFTLEQTIDQLRSDVTTYTYIYDWQAFDYIDVAINFYGAHISSINAFNDSLSVPYEVSYLSSSIVPNDQNASIDGITSESSWYVMNVRLFISEIDRTISTMPCIAFYGSINGLGYFTVESVTGHIYNSDVSPINAFWLKLKTFFTDLLGSSSDQQSSADQFQAAADDQSSRLDYADSEIAEIEKPFLGDMNFEVNNMVDPNVLTLTTSGISTALSNNIFLKVLIMALTMALAGFILYGKK